MKKTMFHLLSIASNALFLGLSYYAVGFATYVVKPSRLDNARVSSVGNTLRGKMNFLVLLVMQAIGSMSISISSNYKHVVLSGKGNSENRGTNQCYESNVNVCRLSTMIIGILIALIIIHKWGVDGISKVWQFLVIVN
jgi:hypothetical protein